MCYDDASTVVLTDGGLFLRGSMFPANEAEARAGQGQPSLLLWTA